MNHDLFCSVLSLLVVIQAFLPRISRAVSAAVLDFQRIIYVDVALSYSRIVLNGMSRSSLI